MSILRSFIILFLYNQPPKELLDAHEHQRGSDRCSPQQTSAAVFVSRDQTLWGASHGPRPRKDTPASSLKHQNSDSMERQEMSLQRVEVQHRTRLCQKYPNNSPRQDMEDSQLSGFGVRIRLRLGKVLHEGAERPQQTRTRKATPAIGWETINSRSSHGLSLPFPESLTWSHLWTQTRASLWVISTDRPLITVRPHQSVSEQSEKKNKKNKTDLDAAFFLTSRNKRRKVQI